MIIIVFKIVIVTQALELLGVVFHMAGRKHDTSVLNWINGMIVAFIFVVRINSSIGSRSSRAGIVMETIQFMSFVMILTFLWKPSS